MIIYKKKKNYFTGNMIQPCEVKLKRLTDFQIHRWTARKNSFKCLVCGQLHGTHNAMYLHILWKHPDRKFDNCRLCNTYIDAAIGLQAHLNECHKGEISTSLKSIVLKCQFCKNIFQGPNRKYNRSQHIKRVHLDVAVRCAAFNCCR